MAGRLTAMTIRKACEPGKFHDGQYGLFLVVRTGGAKYFVQRLTVNGKRCELGLGPWPLLSLAEARDQCIDNARAARAGDLTIRSRRKAPTLAEAVDEYLTLHGPSWRGDRTEAQWRANFDQYILPTLGNRCVDTITSDDVLGIVEPHWAVRPRVARNIHNRISRVMAWCITKGHRAGNPSTTVLAALPKDRSSTTHRAAIPYSRVGEVIAATYSRTSVHIGSRLCLRFVALTATRSGEARGATWDEVDLDERVWTIPGERTKTGREHRVPLSDAAVAVLNEARNLPPTETRLIFPSKRGKSLRDDSLMAAYRSLEVGGTVHGLRSAFRDWAAECSSAPREVAEAALAHVAGATERAYRRSDLFEQRAELMNDWADYIDVDDQ